MESWQDKVIKNSSLKNGDLVDNFYREQLQNLSWVSSRGLDQTLRLFKLCDRDFDTLLQLEAKLKRYMVFATPSTKEEVNKILTCENYECIMETMGYVKNKVGLHSKES